MSDWNMKEFTRGIEAAIESLGKCSKIENDNNADRIQRGNSKPLICERCGAPYDGKRCEYCGTRYGSVGAVNNEDPLRVDGLSIERAYDCTGQLILEYTRRLGALTDQ